MKFQNKNQMMEIQTHKLKEILRVGKVISVKGRVIEVLVDKTKNNSHLLLDGQLIRNVSVGSYIKITKGFEQLIGKIESEFVVEDRYFSSSEYRRERDKVKRTLLVSLVGYLGGDKFEQGIKELPLLDNECFILTKNEYDKVHNFIKDGDESINIGVLASETSKEIEIGINSLFASHIGIFGNTGSGKSYSLASLYHSLFKEYGEKSGFKKNAKFLLIDFNGEYSEVNSITEKKKVYKLTTRKKIDEISVDEKLPLNESVIIDVEIISILAEATEKTQKPFIKRAIELYNLTVKKEHSTSYFIGILKNKFISILQSKNKERAFELLDFFNNIISKQIPDFKGELLNLIEWHDNKSCFKPNGNTTYNFDNLEDIENLNSYVIISEYVFSENKLELLIDFLYVQIIEDLLVNRARNEHISPAINKLKSKTKDLYKVINFEQTASSLFDENNLVIIDLNDVKVDIKKTIPLLIAYKSYQDQKVEFRKSLSSSLNIIIDEAHNILSHTSSRESESWKDYRLEVFEEIIKEGRKFGTFLTVASQRPSDISSTIISQLHNYFLHRLINNKDIEGIEKTVSYLDRVSFESLPILPTGTCIIAGLSAKLPVVVKMNPLDKKYQPNSHTINLTDFWNKNSKDIEREKDIEANNPEFNDEEDDDLPF